MSKLLHSKVIAGALILAAPVLLAARVKQADQLSGPQRVMSIIENGPVVTLRLENGKDLEVARSVVKIKNAAHRNEKRDKSDKGALSISQLAQMSALPAIVSLSYGHDGSVKKAKIRVFRNEDDMNAFFAARNARAAATASQNREQHH